uniref:Uncharacterized protein n=2 Tax=Anopheles arabiensis TaxID=7173 RepID=A0A182I2W5_ANOAR
MASAVVSCICRDIAEYRVTHVVPEECLNYEINRLRTYDLLWTVPYIYPEELARWGFFYTGYRDCVRCYFCRIELGGWDEHDVVIEEHLKWSPHCRLMTKRPTNNVPIDPDFLDQLGEIVPDTTGTGSTIAREMAATAAAAESNRLNRQNELERQSQRTQNDTMPFYRQKYPQYRIEGDRLATFKEWPKSMPQTPERMADAGFFYTGKSDVVACFYCGGNLRDWLAEDDPWVEHVRNFSECPYVKLVKTPEFIAECRGEKVTNSALIASSERSGLGNVSKDKEQDEVSDEKCCKICFTRPFDTVFMPCGHVVACGRCAATTTKCPMCNEPYTSVQRIYFS